MNGRSSLVPWIALAALAVLATVPPAQAGPWTRPAGEGYVQAALYAILPYDEVFGGEAPFVTSREMVDLTIEAYVEHGLTDAWTLLGAVPAKWVASGDAVAGRSLDVLPEEGSRLAPGAVRLGLRRALTRDGWVSAVQFDVELPTGTFDETTGLRTGIDGTALVPSVRLGRGGARSYGFAHFGVALRTGGYSEQIRAGFEYGRRVFGGEWLFVAGIEVVQSLRNEPRRDTIRDGERPDEITNLATALYLDEQEVIAPVLKAIRSFGGRWGVMGTVQGGFTGNQVARSPFLGFAIFAHYGRD